MENFTAASEINVDGNDLMMEDHLEINRAANGYVKCGYCPKKEPYCHGVCDDEEEACVVGYCSKYSKPYKVSDQVRLSGIAHELYTDNRNNGYEYLIVSMYNAFPQACDGKFVPPAIINMTVCSGCDNGNFITDYGSDEDEENDVDMRYHYSYTSSYEYTYGIEFSVNSQQAGVGSGYGSYSVLKSISADVHGQNCELVTSQPGPYMLLPIYKTKKGDKKIIGCYITNQ